MMPDLRDRILGALWGGVPVEFTSCEERLVGRAVSRSWRYLTGLLKPLARRGDIEILFDQFTGSLGNNH